MENELLEYECPACGGMLEFDTASQMLKCPYCDTKYDVEEFRKRLAEKQKKAEEAKDSRLEQSNAEWVDDNLLIYVCQSCGGEIIGDKTLGATSCPFCGNNVVMTKQFKGALKPDCMIPFKIDKEAAKAALKKHFEGKKLLPPSFKTESKLDEVKGVYVPFFLFNVDATGRAEYNATNVRTSTSGNYDYRETKHFDIKREAIAAFDDVPADASTKMADDLMDSIEPYDYKALVPFNPAYLAGFLADKYDVEADKLVPRIRPRVESTLSSQIDGTVGKYTTLNKRSRAVVLDRVKSRYALLPVWVLTTRWNDKPYVFAMNGQTGKFVGNLPMDKKLYFKYLAKYTGLIGIIGGTISFLFYMSRYWF